MMGLQSCDGIVSHFPSLVPPVNRSMYLFDKNQPTLTDWLSTAFPGNKANGQGAIVDAQGNCACATAPLTPKPLGNNFISST
jgi:hypothetical protein